MATNTKKRTFTTQQQQEDDYDINKFGGASNKLRRSVQLPHDIVYDILTRVPIESLTRFRRVCKQWSTLILDPSFVDLHSRRGGSNSPAGFIFHSTDDDRTRLFFFDLVKMQKKEISFRLRNGVFLDKKIDILYSLNGLLLISSTDTITGTLNYHVCNPMTGCSTILPLLNLHVRKNLIFGLAYDSVMAKYKAVCCGNYSVHKNECFCKIVTVGVQGDSWRDVIVPKLHHLPDYPPVFASGALHWTSGKSLHRNLDGSIGCREPESERQILSMDVSREMFYAIRCPPQRNSYSVRHSLVEMKGLLCCIDHVWETRLKLWVLKEHEWTKLCNIKMDRHIERSRLTFWDFFGCYIPIGLVRNPTNNKNSKMIIMCFDSFKGMMKMFYSYDMELNQLDDRIITWSPWRQYQLQWPPSGDSSALQLKPWNDLIPIYPERLPNRRHYSSGHPTSDGMIFSPHWHVNTLANF